MPLLADIFSEWPSNITNLNAIIEAQGHIIDLQRYLNLKIITMYRATPSKLLIVSTFKLLSKTKRTTVNQLKMLNKNNEYDFLTR